jgi:hypothetical protein
MGDRVSEFHEHPPYIHEIAPGETCPTCKRRKSYPKKEATPVTKVKAYRVPVDEAVAHDDVLTEAAKFLGTFERPYWQWATYTIALALVLQDENLRGYAQRAA